MVICGEPHQVDLPDPSKSGLADAVEKLDGVKGIATVRLPNSAVRIVELHWYEAHGIGKKDLKIKRYLED